MSQRRRHLSSAGIIAALLLGACVAAGCATGSEPPPTTWQETTSGTLSGARPRTHFLGTFYFVRARLVFSPDSPAYAHRIVLKVVDPATGDSSAAWIPRSEVDSQSAEFELGAGRQEPGEYQAYLVERTSKDERARSAIDYTLYTWAPQ
jgi:hypothetical protein